MATLFQINGTNVTPDMDVQNYAMNAVDEYTEWLDGNGVKHRDVYRTRVSGSFSLLYTNGTDYASFQTLLSTAKQADNSFPVSAYVNNTDTTDSLDVYLTTATSVKRDDTNGRVWIRVDVSVEEI